MSASATLAALEKACAAAVEEASDADAVLGVRPQWVARPGSTHEVSDVLRAAAAHDLATVVRGSGTKLGWGAAPQRCDLVLDLGRLDRVVEHTAGDLVVVTQAGLRLADLQARLAGSRQWLGIDPTRSGTVGGAVATAATGPLRLRHGAVRDLVIGMTLVRADGVVAHSGGKVVKNVAGYDLGKLLTGSFGTLAVVTEVAFRLHPVPPGRQWVGVAVTSVEDAGRAVQALVHSQLLPAAVELDWTVGGPDGSAQGRGEVVAELQGHLEGARACALQAAELLGPGALVSDTPPSWWAGEPGPAVPGEPAAPGEPAVPGEPAAPGDRGSQASTTLCRVGFAIGALAPLLDALAWATSRTGARGWLRGSAGVGSAMLALEGDPEQVVAVVGSLRERAEGFGGSVVVLEAPGAVRSDLDVWGPVRGLSLMRSVKAQFDPARRLAPGRFVGGI